MSSAAPRSTSASSSPSADTSMTPGSSPPVGVETGCSRRKPSRGGPPILRNQRDVVALVDSDLQDSVLTITLADEERRNALSAQLMQELVELCEQADRDPSVRVVILTNRGNTFCAGANLSERADSGASNPASAMNPADLFGRFRRSPKPYVGRIDGH